MEVVPRDIHFVRYICRRASEKRGCGCGPMTGETESEVIAAV